MEFNELHIKLYLNLKTEMIDTFFTKEDLACLKIRIEENSHGYDFEVVATVEKGNDKDE